MYNSFVSAVTGDTW